MKECTDFVLERFSFIGVEEIKQAFRLAASGENDVDLNTYHGKFNVNLLGKVLISYKEYRLKIASAIAEQQHMQNEEAVQFYWQSPQGIEVIKAHLEKRVRHLKAYPDAVSAKDYDRLTAYGFFEVSLEQKRLLIEKARRDILKENADNQGNVDISELQSELNSEIDFFEVRVRNRAKKMAVLDYINQLIDQDLRIKLKS